MVKAGKFRNHQGHLRKIDATKCRAMQLAGQKQYCDSASSEGLLSVHSIRFATTRVPFSLEDSWACCTRDAALLIKCPWMLLATKSRQKDHPTPSLGEMPTSTQQQKEPQLELAKKQILLTCFPWVWQTGNLHIFISNERLSLSIQNANVRFDLGSCAKQQPVGACGGTHVFC